MTSDIPYLYRNAIECFEQEHLFGNAKFQKGFEIIDNELTLITLLRKTFFTSHCQKGGTSARIKLLKRTHWKDGNVEGAYRILLQQEDKFFGAYYTKSRYMSGIFEYIKATNQYQLSGHGVIFNREVSILQMGEWQSEFLTGTIYESGRQLKGTFKIYAGEYQLITGEDYTGMGNTRNDHVEPYRNGDETDDTWRYDDDNCMNMELRPLPQIRAAVRHLVQYSSNCYDMLIRLTCPFSS